MASQVSDTWQATCHNAWQRHACVAHGMPCVNMHAHHEGYKNEHGQLISESSSFSPWEQQGGGGREREEREGGREERRGERKEEKRRG